MNLTTRLLIKIVLLVAQIVRTQKHETRVPHFISLFRRPFRSLFNSFPYAGTRRPLELNTILNKSITAFYNASKTLSAPEFIGAVKETGKTASNFARSTTEIVNELSRLGELKTRQLSEYDDGTAFIPSLGFELLLHTLTAPLRWSLSAPFRLSGFSSQTMPPLLPSVGDVVRELTEISNGGSIIHRTAVTLNALLRKSDEVVAPSLEMVRSLRDSDDDNSRQGSFKQEKEETKLYNVGGKYAQKKKREPIESNNLSWMISKPVELLHKLSEELKPLSKQDSEQIQMLMSRAEEGADMLSAQADSLGMTFSGGILDPLSPVICKLESLVKSLGGNALSKMTWVDLSNGILNVGETLKRMPLIWQLSEAQQNIVENSVRMTDQMLGVLTDDTTTLTSSTLNRLDKLMNRLGLSLRKLDCMPLKPRLFLHGMEVTDNIKLNVKTPEINFKKVEPILVEGFGFHKIVENVAKVLPLSFFPNKDSNNEGFNLIPLTNGALSVSIPVIADQLTAFREIVMNLQDALLTSTNAVAANKVYHDSNTLLQDPGILRALQVDATLLTIDQLRDIFNQLLLNFPSLQLPQNSIDRLSTRASVLKSLGRQTGRKAYELFHEVTTPILEGWRPRQLESENFNQDDQVSKALLDIADFLRDEALLLLKQTAHCLNSSQQAAVEVIRAKTLATDPADALLEHGISKEEVTQALLNEENHIDVPGNYSKICSIKKSAFNTIKSWAPVLIWIADTLEAMATAKDEEYLRLLNEIVENILIRENLPAIS